jgi:hypothetical protein
MRYREEILSFLLEHKGWIKKSSSDLCARLKRLGMESTEQQVKEIQAEARQKIKYMHPNDTDSLTENMRIKKVWFTPEGKMGVSYISDEDTETSNDLLDSIRQIVEKGVPSYTPAKASSGHNSLMLSIFSTDKHIGASNPMNSIYSNIYDREEIFNRHDRLMDRILDQKKKFGKFEKFVFYDLGDALDGNNGQTVRGGHTLPQNMSGREQIDCYIEVTLRTMEYLIENDIAKDIWFIATSNDNHSGAVGHGALRAVQIYLQTRYPHVNTFVTSKMLDHITMGDHTYIFGHGKDDSDMKAGLPLFLDARTENFINDYIDRKQIRSKYIHVVKGDLHQTSVGYAKRFRYVNNLSMYGSSKWIHSNFGSGTAGVDYEITELYGEEIYRSRLTYGHDA